MLEIIRLSGFLARVPLQEKLPLLEHLHNEMGNFYSVKELCEALEVARGTFYNHIFRRADSQKYQDEKMHLMLNIKQIFDDGGQRYGAGKIRAVLAGTGQQVSTKRVSSIMRELGLQSVRTDAKKFYIKLQHRKKRNLLQRHFTADRPNQVWVIDITYFKINNSRVYLCTIIDLFSRRVVGYRISHSASTRLVTSTFRKAYAERGNPTELTFHRDRGGQNTSLIHLRNFCKIATSSNLFQRSAAHMTMQQRSPLCNVQKEEAYRREYTSERHFQKCVEEYIQFYNEGRPHQTLDYKTPQAFEAAHEGNYIGK